MLYRIYNPRSTQAKPRSFIEIIVGENGEVSNLVVF